MLLLQLNVSFDVIWTNWSNAFDKMTMTMTNGTNSNINTMLGSSDFVFEFPLKWEDNTMTNGTNSNINTMIGSSDFVFEFPLKWEDNITLKFGGEYICTDQFTFRMGYAYNSNPVVNIFVPINLHLEWAMLIIVIQHQNLLCFLYSQL